MKDLEKIAFFDFCETLVNFQTADAFVDYIRNSHGRKKRMVVWNFVRILMIHLKVIYILTKLFPKKSIHKRLVLFQLKGYTNVEIDNYAYHFYIDRIRPNLIEPVIYEMKRFQKEQFRIVLISGGYDVYLKYFAQEFNIQDVVSTKIKFSKNGICCGTFDGIDCLWENKVLLLSRLYSRDMIYSIGLSDSKTDRYLLEWVDKGIVVRNRSKEIWDFNKQFEEFVW